ncbi:MAG: hypothetical protein IJ297_01350 [Clostridia bacterium]|nr:hypothetical protein [Clostridia bacterium]
MKKNKVYIVSSIIIILLCVANIIFGNSIRDYRQIRNINYDEANEKTQGFD